MKLIETLALIFVAGIAQAETQPDIFKSMGLKITGAYKSIPSKAYEPSGMTSAQNENGDIIKILAFPNTQLAEAKQKIGDRSLEIERKYQRTVEPYFGTVRDETDCVKQTANLKDAPKESERSLLKMIHLSANENFVMTGCDGKSVLRATLIFLYCKRAERYFEIKYFSKNASVAPSVDCS